jgi:hypothetical protein
MTTEQSDNPPASVPTPAPELDKMSNEALLRLTLEIYARWGAYGTREMWQRNTECQDEMLRRFRLFELEKTAKEIAQKERDDAFAFVRNKADNQMIDADGMRRENAALRAELAILRNYSRAADELTVLRQANKAANRLISESADEKKKISDSLTALRSANAELAKALSDIKICFDASEEKALVATWERKEAWWQALASHATQKAGGA